MVKLNRSEQGFLLKDLGKGIAVTFVLMIGLLAYYKYMYVPPAPVSEPQSAGKISSVVHHHGGCSASTTTLRTTTKDKETAFVVAGLVTATTGDMVSVVGFSDDSKRLCLGEQECFRIVSQ